MKKSILSFCLSLLCTTLLFSQSNFKEAIEQADHAFQKGEFKTAIDKYFAAEAFDPSKKKEVKEKINHVFDKITALKASAEKAKIDIEKTLQQVKIEKENTKKALAKVEAEQDKTEAALAKAEAEHQKNQKIIDAFYFYDGKFALAYKEGHYGFINKNGDVVIDYKYNKAIPFDNRNGFATVEKGEGSNSSTFWIDTTGKEFLYTEKVESLSEKTKALKYDFDFLKNDELPVEIFQTPSLQILLLTASLSKLPEEIGNLNKLIYLDLGANDLETLPKSLSKLTLLKNLNLGLNSIKIFPEPISDLKELTRLNLTFNSLTELPASFANLTKLEYLDLSFNNFTSFPSSLLKLKNLKELDFEGGTISKEEQEVINKKMPWCKISWDIDFDLDLDDLDDIDLDLDLDED